MLHWLVHYLCNLGCIVKNAGVAGCHCSCSWQGGLGVKGQRADGVKWVLRAGRADTDMREQATVFMVLWLPGTATSNVQTPLAGRRLAIKHNQA